MPTIGAAVSVETKSKFESVARARGTTSSRLGAAIIEEFLKLEWGGTPSLLPEPEPAMPTLSTVAAAVPGTEPRSKQVFVRLEPYYYAELNRLAAERAWFAGTYLANLFHAHVDRRPVLCNAEINAVRQVARQLADMGRNLSEVARKLRMPLEHADLVAASVDFEVVRMLIETETKAVKNLMRANVRGWGISDV